LLIDEPRPSRTANHHRISASDSCLAVTAFG
jgi:hypothetical protein